MPRPARLSSLVVGVISDTHGLVRPEALSALADCDHILHAGDIGGAEVLAALRKIGPLHVVRGNNDREEWAESIPEVERLRLAGSEVCLVHDQKTLPFDPADEGVEVVIAGHTHRPMSEQRGPVLYANPGSAGPRRFGLPIGVGRLTLTSGSPPDWRWIELLSNSPAR